MNHFHLYRLHSVDLLQLLFSVFFGVLMTRLRSARLRRREALAGGWPVAEAIVQAARLLPSPSYTVQLEYRYYAQSEYRYGKNQQRFQRKERAEAFATLMRGRQVPVHYLGAEPDTSVMIEGELEWQEQIAGSVLVR